MSISLRSYLNQRLGDFVEANTLEALSSSLENLPGAVQRELVDLGLLLSDFSSKSAVEYFTQIPKLISGISPEQFTSYLPPWLGIGIQVAQKSGAAGVKFFRESPDALQRIAGSIHRHTFLPAVQKVVEADPSLALVSLKAATKFRETPMSLDSWVDVGLSLSAKEYTLGVEYFQITPTLLHFLSTDDLPLWVKVGMQLAEAPRYFDTIVFYRLSPDLIQQVQEDLRSKLLALLKEIGNTSPAEVIPLFKEAPALCSKIGQGDRSGGLAEAALEVAIQIATIDGVLAAQTLRKTPEVLKALGGSSHRYLDWVSGGLSLLRDDLDRARGYFTLVSREGREALDRQIGGVSLLQIEGLLKTIATALGGRPLAIRSLPTEGMEEALAPLPKTDGLVLYLPAHLRLFSDNQDNFRWYKVAVAYAAARVEFGSYTLSSERFANVKSWLNARHGLDLVGEEITSFIDHFPLPLLFRDLFYLTEGARIDALLRRNYQGLSRDMDRIVAITLDRRLPIAGKPVLEAVVELLLQISLAGKTREPIPSTLQAIVFDACRMLGVVQEPEATVETALRAACEVYFILDPKESAESFPEGPMERFEEQGRGQRGEGERSGNYRPADPLAHRGEADLEPARKTQKLLQEKAAEFIEKLKEAGTEVSVSEASKMVEDAYRSAEVSLDQLQQHGALGDWMQTTIENVLRKSTPTGARAFIYPEWDCTIEGYREAWCRLQEEELALEDAGGFGFAEKVRQERKGEIFDLRRLFESLRPSALRKTRGEEDGDEVDLDALIADIAERKSGRSPRMRVYTRRSQRERSVAVTVLVDLSGSTGRQIAPGRSVLTVEKEGLVLLSEALEAVGDPTALFGFSGQGRDCVRFYKIKEFGTPWREAYSRINAIRASHQNRDGTAIRHATTILSRRTEKIKLLILMSDGRPLDDAYEGSYAFQDTRRALQEAKDKGIYPYCITVDSQGPDYIGGIYGDVAYTVIDDVSSLPRRLPIIYRKLTT